LGDGGKNKKKTKDSNNKKTNDSNNYKPNFLKEKKKEKEK
jgi:hypothetical protein